MPWYRHFLWPFAFLYGLGVFVRNRFFDFGLLKSKGLEVPIICVGNLEVGGTGKSPLILYILKVLTENGLEVAVLSRGYGRKTSGFRLVDHDCNAQEVGDEPIQAKLRFPNVTVVVCENRVEGARKLIELNSKLNVILLDDGFQHRWIRPKLSILTASSKQSLSKNYLLPVGTLREPLAGLHRAQAVVVTGNLHQQALANFKGTVLGCSLESGELTWISGERRSPNDIKSVLLFSGIANSERFEQTASRNFKISDHIQFGDHHNYSTTDLQLLQEKYNSFGAAEMAIVTTEKDAARLLNSNLLNQLDQIPVFYLPVDVFFNETTAAKFDKMILSYGKHA